MIQMCLQKLFLTRMITRYFHFCRKIRDDEVLVILNFSGGEINFQVKGVHGVFRNVFGGRDINFDIEDHVYLKPWGYFVFEKLPMLSDRNDLHVNEIKKPGFNSGVLF